MFAGPLYQQFIRVQSTCGLWRSPEDPRRADRSSLDPLLSARSGAADGAPDEGPASAAVRVRRLPLRVFSTLTEGLKGALLRRYRVAALVRPVINDRQSRFEGYSCRERTSKWPVRGRRTRYPVHPFSERTYGPDSERQGLYMCP